ncbi:HAD family hydrolase [Streptomyces sp. NBC_00212]|uniref:HAD family hydrolase n=1 Tax=Streptomyces sp. NBC_00212 TaxID=2975684 RepID=UPI002F90FC47
MIRAAVFDLDGTLADTPDVIGKLLVKVCAEQGRDVDAAAVAPTIGKPLEASVARLLGREVSDDGTVRAVARYRELFDAEVLTLGSSLLYADVAQGLRELRAQGVLLAVGTSKITASAEKVLDATGLRDLFDPVIGNDQVRHPKPDPEMGLLAATELGVPVEQCAYIGDTVTDMQMAKAAGMVPVAVTYGVGGREEMAQAGHEICHSFSAVVRTVLARVPASPAGN